MLKASGEVKMKVTLGENEEHNEQPKVTNEEEGTALEKTTS